MSRIGCDVDGCLADFDTRFIALIKSLTGRDLFPSKDYVPHCWNYAESFGYTTTEIDRVWAHIIKSPWWWYDLPAYPDIEASVSYLATLAHAGHDLYFITSRPGILAKFQTEEWLRAQFLQAGARITAITVLISSAKGLCARALQLDAYIDDRWENALEIQSPPTRPFLLNRLWNTSYNAPKFGITRVDRLAGFVETPLEAVQLT